jgi:hypothetical protein
VIGPNFLFFIFYFFKYVCHDNYFFIYYLQALESGNHILVGFQGGLSTIVLNPMFDLNYLVWKPKLHLILMSQEEILLYLKQCLDVYTNQHRLKEAHVCLLCWKLCYIEILFIKKII